MKKSDSSPSKRSKGKVLLVGCGELGVQTAGLLQASHYDAVGARRTVHHLPESLPALCIDITQPATLKVLSEQQWHAVIITLTADSFSAEAYRKTYVQGLQNVLRSISGPINAQAASALPLLLFASSTSVYGQTDGSDVDEYSPTFPRGFSGQTMLEAEALIDLYPGPACSIRFGGIYGRGKSRLIARLQAGEICPSQPTMISNRIHHNDCCHIFMHLLQQHEAGRLLDARYLAVDSGPTPLHDVMQWLANQNKIPLESLTEGAVIGRGGNKRCLNNRLLASGFNLTYPTFKEGFSDFQSL